jgi:hypothetical protein
VCEIAGVDEPRRKRAEALTCRSMSIHSSGVELEQLRRFGTPSEQRFQREEGNDDTCDDWRGCNDKRQDVEADVFETSGKLTNRPAPYHRKHNMRQSP